MPEFMNLDAAAPEHPAVFWPHTIPNLISEDPPGRRPLFDAIVAYTACLRYEEIPVVFEVYSAGSVPRLIELALKSYIDITRGSSRTISKVDTFYRGHDPLRMMFRWGLLQHLVVQNLGDNNPRTPWVNFLTAQTFSNCYLPTNDVQIFYLEALRYISSGSQHLPQSLLNFRQNYQFLAVPGMDLIYFALVKDYASLRYVCYHILSSPRLEYLYFASLMINGARLCGEPCLDMIAADLETASRNITL